MKKRSQGEIFGLALMFVVIIIGIIVYSKISALSDLRDEDLQVEGEYKILAEGSLNTILKTSTGCSIQRDKDSLKDLINFCLENEYSGVDPIITCNDDIDYRACEKVNTILNETMFILFNSSLGIGNIPFTLSMDVPANSDTLLSNKSFSNFGEFEYRDVIINDTNRYKYGFKRAPSGLISWSTAQRAIEFELYLYYR